MTNKRALIVSPYLDHLGGGERYMLQAGAVIGKSGYDLTFAWDNQKQITSLAKQLGLTLPPISLAPEIKKLYFGGSPLAMWRSTRSYDLVLYMSDGSIPLLGGRKNLLHMQVPFHDVGGRSLANKLKLSQINQVIVNSRFTKNVVDQEYGLDSHVIYPPLSPIKPGKKDKVILSVGRFEPSLNVKRHDILLQAFRALSPQLPGWKLILAGAAPDDKWINQLMDMAVGLPVEFALDIGYTHLTELYQTSSIYWHAAGYHVDPAKQPELCEHFGISVAEAISAGCIPLVVGQGGIPEIVPDEKYHWQELGELVNLTRAGANGQLIAPQLPLALSFSSFQKQIKALC